MPENIENGLPKLGATVEIRMRKGQGDLLDTGTVVKVEPMYRVQGPISTWDLPASLWDPDSGVFRVNVTNEKIS